MSDVKDKLITAENLKNAYDDNKRQIGELKGDLDNLPKSKTHYSDFQMLNEKTSKIRLIPNNNIGIIARLKQTIVH